MSGKFLTGAPLNQQRDEIPYRAVLESGVRGVDRGRNLIRRELRIPACEPLHNLGDHQLFTDLGHLDRLAPSTQKPSTAS